MIKIKKVTPKKQTIGKQIETCIKISCVHFGYKKPEEIYLAIRLASIEGQKARAAVWQHMRDCGYVGYQLSHVFKRATHHINAQLEKHLPSFNYHDNEMMRSMPFVEGGKGAK